MVNVLFIYDIIQCGHWFWFLRNPGPAHTFEEAFHGIILRDTLVDVGSISHYRLSWAF